MGHNFVRGKMREIVYCYIDGSGQEIVNTMQTSVTEEHASMGYEFEERVVRIWKNSVTGKETLNIPIGRVVFVREVESY